MKYTTINIQGNLLSEEILDQIEQASIEGQSPKDFGLDPNANLRGDMEYAWSRMKLDWKHFLDKTQNLTANDSSSTALTKKWMSQFFATLNFELTAQKSPLMGENGQSYTISHTAHNLDDFPLHIVGFRAPENKEKSSLDIKGANARLSPHANIQEYLNVTEHLYGLIANGFTLRLLRDSGRLVKLAYIEFDLKAMFEEDRYNEFTVIYRLLHSSRFPQKKTETCLLEKYHQDSIESGNRIREKLSAAVKESLLALGKGFLQHENNEDLRQKLKSKQLSHKDLHRQLLRLIYRFLFLMVTEERDLIFAQDEKEESILHKKRLYFQYYSLQRLRKMSQNRSLFQAEFTDLWLGLMQTFQLFEESGYGKPLAIQPLAGDLFHSKAIEDLENCLISNQLLLECVSNLNEFIDEKKNRIRINYRSLNIEELGSIYEGLLDLHLVIENLEAENPAHIHFTFHEGTDRKTTGSYYTRPDLVNELIKSALIPVIESRLQQHKGNKNAQEQALLKLKVCDAAAGSGHILLEAARTIAWYLARVQSGEDNPSPTLFRTCLRQVIQHCIYAVDYNPDAVELCKLALWLESHNSGKPISFLDHKIRNGNSLVGVTDLNVLRKGIPDEAFSPVTGDDKEMCKLLKKDNAHFRKTKQTSLEFEQNDKAKEGDFSQSYQDFENLAQDDIAAVNQVKYKYQQLRSSAAWRKEDTACNLWTAAFFFPYLPENKQIAPTSERLEKYLQNPVAAYAPMVGKANALAVELKFFHWALEFPDVFAQGGFDVMLGNPPWERIKLQQQEYFATRDKDIAEAANAAARNKMIQNLPQTKPLLYQSYQQAVHDADSTGKFLRESGRCKLTAVGDINTYSIFAELNSRLIQKKGRTGFIVPTGIATDDSNKAFFGEMVESNRLVSLFDFENKAAIFPSVHRSYKFCLLTLAGADIGTQAAKFGFFLTQVTHLQDTQRVFSLGKDDFLRLNPNTKTCPVFRTSIDATLTAKIYKRVPILLKEANSEKKIKGENPWGVSFMAMFHMSNDSHLFRIQAELEKDGFVLQGNVFEKEGEKYFPLYESKMIWHYDHRYGSYKGVDSRTSTQTPTPTLAQYQNPDYVIHPWYWVAEKEILMKLAKVPTLVKQAFYTQDETAIFYACAIWLTAHYQVFIKKYNEQKATWVAKETAMISEILRLKKMNMLKLQSEIDTCKFELVAENALAEMEQAMAENATLAFAWHIMRKRSKKWLMGFRDITNNTNERTFVCSIIPPKAVNNKLPLLNTIIQDKAYLLLANISSIIFDYVARQKIGGTSMTFFYLKQFPALPPSAYTPKHLAYILPRVLELVYTAYDMQPFAEEIWAESSPALRHLLEKQWEENALSVRTQTRAEVSENPPNLNCPLPPFKWDEERRAVLKAELDALYADMYGLNMEELRYILDPQDVYGADFPGETFRVLKDKDIRKYGEYRTKRLVLAAWERLQSAKAQEKAEIVAIQNAIYEGENKNREFKSSYRWDVKHDQKNERLEFEIFKTIAAFLNSDGGDLYIGITDEGSVYGLEKDLTTFDKGTDGILLLMDNRIKDWLGNMALSQYIRSDFYFLEDKQIAKVSVKASHFGVYCKYPKEVLNKTTGLMEIKSYEQVFFARSQASTRKLSVEEIAVYVQGKWG